MSASDPRIPLPNSWPKQVRSALLHVISLAQFATAYTRGWVADGINTRIRIKAELDRVTQELVLLREEIRIKDARMGRINPYRRPYYPPKERMAVLELRAARGWSLEQTARVFQVTAATIASWTRRIDEEGTDALVQIRSPVNRFPDFVRYAVQRLKVLCPTMGKVKIAQTLARARLHISATMIGRMLKEDVAPIPQPSGSVKVSARVVTAKYPNHVWHIDLTAVPIGLGFWCSWMPFSLPQQFPFCWWVAVIVDHSSRRMMGIAVSANRPNCRNICTFLGRTISHTATPKYIICDRDSIFDCNAFRRWVRRKGIKPPRYGAIGKHGSVAVVERLILSMKDECTRRISVPISRDVFRRELHHYRDWYNGARPHMTLGGKTPNEAYHQLYPANRRPRIEPRIRWPRGSPCAKPWALVAGNPGDRFAVKIDHHAGRRHLPIVTLRRAA